LQCSFEQDKAAGLPVPNRTFDACVVHPGQVDKYQTAAFDNNRYSVPQSLGVPRRDRERVRRSSRDRGRWAGHCRTPTELPSPGKSARSPAFSGGFGTQTRRARPRTGLPRLATPGRGQPTSAATSKPASGPRPASATSSASCNSSIASHGPGRNAAIQSCHAGRAHGRFRNRRRRRTIGPRK